MAQFNTRLALRYDTWANWKSTTATDKGANLVLLKGEIGICSIPADTNAGQSTSEPVILFKVGDGSSKFSALPWISAKAADVYSWAKQTEAQFVTNFLAMTDGSKTMQEHLDSIFATDKALADAVAALEKEISDLAVATLKGRVDTLEGEVDALQTAVNTTLPDQINAVDAKFANYTNTTGMNSAIAAALASAQEYADNNDADTTYTFASGTTKGAFNVTPKNGAVQSVAVYGLGTAAYEAKGAFATSAQGAKADSAVQPADLTAAIEALDVTDISGFGEGKTLKTLVETDGKISATFQDIKITKSQVTDFGSYDEAGAASQALADAKEYADGLNTTMGQRVDGKQDTLSETQLAAVNSGIDATKVAKYENFFSEAGAEGVMDTLTEIVEYIAKDEQGAINLAKDVAANAAAIEDIVDGTTTVAKATNAEQLGGSAAADYLKKSEATGYNDILTKTVAASTYQPKGEYATAAQGAKADSAVQSIKVLGETLSDGDELTVAEAKTALGLKSAAYTESSAYATAAQGTKADNAAAAIATYGDIVTHNVNEFATADQGAKADSAVQSVALASGTNNGTLKLTVNGTATDNIAVKGLGSAAYTASTAYDAAGAADTAEANAKSYADGLIAALDSSVSATAVADGQYSVLTGITEVDGKLTDKTEVKLAKVATSGKMDDLTQTDTIVFYCGTASEVL